MARSKRRISRTSARSPRGSVARLFLLCLMLAVAGAIILLVMRPDILRRVRQESDALDALARSAMRRIQPDIESAWKRLSERIHAPQTVATSSPASGSPGITVYFSPCVPDDASGGGSALLHLIRGARKSIICALYELEWSDAADALIERHHAGVAVRIVSDSDYKDRPAMRACIAAGIPAVFDERKPFMHDKFIVVDGAIVWTGSTNVTENCLFRNNNNALRIESEPLAVDYAREFEEMFTSHLFGGGAPRATPYPQVDVKGTSVECYFAPEDDVQEEILDELQPAQRAIDFMAFSFTSKPIAETMAQRIPAGVRVRGVFERRNAGSTYSKDEYLSSQGAQIYLDDNPHTMHHKVIIVDASTVITGSYNFSQSAEERNDENVLIIHSPDIAKAYEQEFERLLP